MLFRKVGVGDAKNDSNQTVLNIAFFDSLDGASNQINGCLNLTKDHKDGFSRKNP